MGTLAINPWRNEGGRYGTVAVPSIDYLTPQQQTRLERIRCCRMLWKGHHRKFYLDEGRTQFDFPDARVQGVIQKQYVPYNVLRLITLTLADLLLGEKPLLRAEDLQPSVDGLVKRTNLHPVLYGAAVEASWAGEAFVEVIRWDGDVYVRNVPPDEVFPIGPMNPDGQHTRYRRYATAARGERTYLLETTYAPGEITRECFLLDGSARKDKVELSQWPGAEGQALLDREATGIEWNTIVWLPNEIDEGQPVSDFDGLLAQQDNLNAKNTQMARVIAKHADPSLIAPRALADMSGNLSRKGVLFVESMAEKPELMVWNAELASAMADRDFALMGLCIQTETSPILLGVKQGATPDAARKLRLEATKSLARTNRKGAHAAPFIRTVLDTALMLEDAGRVVKVGIGGVDGNGVGAAVELRDGLPVDELDEAQVLSLKTGGKAVMSVERAVEQQLPDAEAAAAEIARLEKAAAAAMPSVFGELPAATPPAKVEEEPVNA